MAPPVHLYRDKRHNHGRVDPRNATRSPIRVLVLTPTRELALQVEESVRTYGARHPIRSTTSRGTYGRRNSDSSNIAVGGSGSASVVIGV